MSIIQSKEMIHCSAKQRKFAQDLLSQLSEIADKEEKITLLTDPDNIDPLREMFLSGIGSKK